MRRTIRWAWNGLAAASVLLSLTTCVLWARSHFARADQIGYGWEQAPGGAVTAWWIESEWGRLTFVRFVVPRFYTSGFTGAFRNTWKLRPDATVPAAFARSYGPDGRLRGVTVSHWVALAVTCTPAVGWVVAARRRRRRERGPAFEVVTKEG